MKIQIGRPDSRMSSSGHGILRSLQNQTLSVVDLIVRESFQNSLDAALDDVDVVNVSIKTSEVKTKTVSPYFNGLTQSLNSKLPSKTTVLSIADSNTSGLTGEVKTNDPVKLDQSNIHKLIYGFLMNQESEDAGGSWGLGKTSFFRIGRGIVIYYSRIKTDSGNYEERLAACLIEDTKSKNRLMPENHRGIAWWGDKDGHKDDYENTYPITDSAFIKRILKDFGVQPYSGDKTGTNIIIPFIDEDEVVYKKNEDVLSDNTTWWESNFSESIEMAIKRWYFPRLLNPKYKERFNQPFLACTVNDKLIQIDKNYVTYQSFRELYDAALTNQTNKNEITVKNVYLKQLGMESKEIPVGRVAYQVKSFADLGISNGHALHPTAFIGEENGGRKSSRKILGYSRKPGMVVEYVIDDNEWMGGVNVSDEEYVFAFFVPNSDGLLHDRYQPGYKTLESYLRATELADHANWTDIYIDKYKSTIIKRIKKEVSKIMSDDLGESLEAISNRRTSSLSRKFGQLFLPKMDFGKAGSTPRNKTALKTPKKRTGRTNASIEILNFKRVDNEMMEISADIFIPKNSTYSLMVNVETTDKIINLESWNKTFGEFVEYPFSVSNVRLEDSDLISMETNNSKSTNKYHFVNEHDKVDGSARITFNLLIKDATMKPNLALTKMK